MIPPRTWPALRAARSRSAGPRPMLRPCPKPAVRTNWCPTFALAWRLPEWRQVLRRCLNRGRQCVSSRFLARFAEAEAEGEANLDRGALTSHRPDDWGHCCSKASVRFQFSEQREILLATLRGLSLCSSGRGTIEAVSSTPSGRCTMRNHDFVSDEFLAVTAASLVLLCSGL